LLAAARGGADVLQIREKELPAKETFDLVQKIQWRLRELELPTQVFVNDRMDVALATGADGVHLPAKSIPVRAAVTIRAQSGWQGQIGCSVHTLDEALEAELEGADYVTFGPIYASGTHLGQPPRGLHALQKIVESISIPVVAIGGIEISNLKPVLATGCDGVAVIGAVLLHADPEGAARHLIEKLQPLDRSPL
jgi:thiamine-phosphate pyrophosphorylase